MQCTFCKAPLDRGALSCDNCHAWVTPERRGRARKTGANEQASSEPQASSQAHVETKLLSLDVERERPTRLVEINVPAVVRRTVRQKARAGRREGQQGAQDLEEEPLLDFVQQGLSAYFKSMRPGDRRTFWAFVLAALGVFLPWTHVFGHGLVSGLEGYGLAALLPAMVGLGCLHLRLARRRWRWALMMLQVVASATVIAVPVYLVITKVLPGWHIGVVVTVVGGLAALPLSMVRMGRM